MAKKNKKIFETAEYFVDTGEPIQLEKDCDEELTEMQAGFRARMKEEQSAFQNATDSEHWVCLCFQSRLAKEEFLTITKLGELGDKYISGHEAAVVLGVELKTKVLEKIKQFKVNDRWKSLTKENDHG